ncbi:DNA cytosine methyltransferase [Sporolactobacillus shoreicorticis]|uniref:DNA (cytosine-5-)-methyltransferase n=1 Tax=Sporolactobacillus shoreicorticis TaxID=1923877 RepID=A0ABW5S596_9BACL|nr:DNA cytosine methyltransferase [Sporolactobacillus shoreicorticis]MCO7127788.1 DNA cytosine methyltransferase [Sporolactobacillus shoreicorticis]
MPVKQLDLFREIIVDNFAGGGGASTGIELATGLNVDIAINHDPDAIAMHKANHPETKHYCESVWDVDPKKACEGRPVGLCWLSPDCKHFSKAKGGKPVSKNIRGLAWIAIKWAISVKPRVIMLENVEEFKTWGPLMFNSKNQWVPDPSKKGMTFKSFVKALRSLGYQVDYKELRACDYGAPTSRKRFFLVARRDGKPITWPEATHADPRELTVQVGIKKPWRTAAEVIDWSVPCKSIFKRKKPLVENTMIRIAKGIEKFIINNPEPFVIKDDRVMASFISQYHSYDSEARGQTLDRPLLTVDTSNRYALTCAFLTKFYKTGIGSDIRQPMPTITARAQHIGAVQAFLVKYYGQSVGQAMTDPLGTVTSHDRFGLVQIYGEPYKIIDVGMRMLQPRELFDAQGFPHNYVIDHDFEGKTYTKSKQVARCGNAVPPQFVEALVRSNMPELCVKKYKWAVAE